jgi:hypothetical protein
LLVQRRMSHGQHHTTPAKDHWSRHARVQARRAQRAGQPERAARSRTGARRSPSRSRRPAPRSMRAARPTREILRSPSARKHAETPTSRKRKASPTSARASGGKAAPRWAARTRPGRLPAVERSRGPGLAAEAAQARPDALCPIGSLLSGRNDHDTKTEPASIAFNSRKKNPKTGKRRNLGTFASKQAAEKHERGAILQTRRLRSRKLMVRSAADQSGRCFYSARSPGSRTRRALRTGWLLCRPPVYRCR